MFLELSFTLKEEMFFNVLKAELIYLTVEKEPTNHQTSKDETIVTLNDDRICCQFNLVFNLLLMLLLSKNAGAIQ